jgi:hypothetical protein
MTLLRRQPKVDAIPSQAQVSNNPSVYLALRLLRDLSGGERPGPGSEVTARSAGKAVAAGLITGFTLFIVPSAVAGN